MPRRSVIGSGLTADERSVLAGIAGALDSWGRASAKAQVILSLADGKSRSETSRLLGVSRPTVYAWVREFECDRAAFLRGVEARHNTAVVQRLVITAVKTRTGSLGYVVDADITNSIAAFDPCAAGEAIRSIATIAQHDEPTRVELIVDASALSVALLKAIRRYASNHRDVFAVRKKMPKDDLLLSSVRLCLRSVLYVAEQAGVSLAELRLLVERSDVPVPVVINDAGAGSQVAGRTGLVALGERVDILPVDKRGRRRSRIGRD